MKHNLLTAANGLQTPIERSQRKSTTSSIHSTLLTSLLALFLLMVGNSALWAGWRYQGQEANNGDGSWGNGDNMTQVGSSDVWYYKVSNVSRTIEFKINNGSWDNENQKYYEANTDDQNRGNVPLVCGHDNDSKHRFRYEPSTIFGSDIARDLYIFVKGDANNPSTSDRVWAVATPVGESALPNKTFKMRGDLFLSDTEHADWADTGSSWVPQFTKLSGDFVARIQLLVPQPKNSESCQIRLEVKNSDNSTPNLTADSDGSNGVSISTNGSTKVLIGISGTGNDNTSVKLLTICYYASNKVSAVLSDCTTGDDWYVYVDKRNKGQLSQGKLTVSSLASGDHSIFLAKGNVSSETEISNPNSQGWAHCISWLGGLHINKNGSDVNWADQYQYSNESRFSSSSVKWPLKGQFDGRGQFNLTSASDVYVRLQNGVITLSTTPPADITYTGKEYIFLSKNQQHTDGNTFDFTADGAHIFVYFWNSETNANAWSDEAFMWDSGDNVLGAKVPAGTWTNCKVVRKNSNDSGKNWNNVWNESHDQTLEAGQNYLRTGESSVWAVYTPPFYLTGSNTLCGAEWGYSGNGTIYNGSATRTNVPAGTYQFKLNPTKSYGSWEHQVNADFIASSGSNMELSSVNDKQIQFTLSEASDVTIAYDGYGVTVNATPYAPPAVTRTVTIHPNNGAANFTMDVADGGTISSIAATYGNGTASWYKDAELTQAFTLNNSTVDEDMDLYAKWGVSGNFYIGGDMWMHEKNGNNWAYYSTMAMTTTDGVASVTYIAPKGRNRFEILTTRSNWSTIANQGSGLIASSTPELSWAKFGPDNNNHFVFDLDAPKKVTIRYNGKVSITAEDYDVVKTGWTVVSPTLFGHGSDDNAEYADNGAFMSGYNVTEGQMDANGERTFLNVAPGTYKFWIGKYNTNLDKTKQQIEVFGAANVDIANSSLTGYGSLADVNNAHINRNIPQDDKLHRRVQFTLTQTASIKIAFDGGKITVNLLPKYTVTFNSNDGSAVASQSVFEGTTASEPSAPTKAGYEFVKWQLSGADYDFSSAVTGNITLDAVWAYKAVSSVALNESEHTTWVGNSDFVLTLTKNPSDLITKTIVWSSNNTSAATVSDGTVHAEGAGTAIITCTVTDMNDNVRSATCEVTIAACEMATDNIYAMTVTGYNSSTGGSATLTGLWNSSEPATLTRCNVRVGNNNGTNDYYAYDNNGQVYADNDATHYWYLYASNSTVGLNPVYYVQDAATGKYMYMTTTFPAGQSSTSNPDWVTYPIMTGDKVDNNDNYLWYAGTGSGSKGVIVCYNGSKQADVSGSTQGQSSCIISRRHWTEAWLWSNSPTHAVGASHGAHQGGGGYTDMQSAFVNVENIPNPAYLASQMNTSYYRMNTNATVQANLTTPLVSGAAITVRLYADANTTVKLQKTDGTEIATINLTADAEHEYTYAGSALLGESAFVIKATDNHAGIASIVVTRTYAASPSDPALAWDTNLSGGVTQSVSGGTFQHEASSTLSSGAVHYSSSDETVATVAADGTVTPHVAGSTTITATIEANGCYAEAYITYNVTLSESTLAELIDATDPNCTLTLTSNYNEDAVIDKPITIDAQGHSIGNLTVQQTGDLTLSSALTVNDFTICAKAGNTSIPAASGQVRNASDLTVNGNAYFLYTVDPSGTVHYGWYDFTVPFPVNAGSGIKGIDGSGLKENFANGVDYAIMEYLGEKQGQGQYPYKKFSGVMQPNKLYSITLDSRDNYNTLRMQKTTEGALVASNTVTLEAYSGDAQHQNWNGVGNGTLHHADAGVNGNYIQVYQSGDKTFLTVNKKDYSFVVGTAFMVQETGTMTLSQATHSQLLAPKRHADVPATAIQIASEGQPFSDQLFISASETGGQAYTPGIDVAKAGNIGNVNVPQIWTNAYDTKLCVHEAQLINGEAQYNLSLYAPAAGTYTLTSLNIPADCTLYLTQNGTTISELSETYTLDLSNGITTEYGLLLTESYKMPTGLENVQNDNVQCTKVLRNGVLYILHNGKVYNAQGGLME